MAESAQSLSLSEALDLSSDGIAVFDRDGRLVAANAPFRSDYAPAAAFLRPGTAWSILLSEIGRRGILPDIVRDRLRLVEAELLDLTGAPDMIELRGRDGQARVIRLHRTSNGGFAWVQSRTLDRAEETERRRQAELVMAKVLEACPASLTMSRIGDGRILYRTPAAADLMGGVRSLWELFADRIERGDFITALLSGARVDDMRVRGRSKGGSGFPASVSARLIDYGGEDVVVASIVDLTDDLAVLEELTRQKELNFQSEKMSALGELLAGVAHELNNPLSIVVGNALILKEELENDRLYPRACRLSDAAERCVRIVRTFLALVREAPLDLAPRPVATLVRAARDAFIAEDPDMPLDVAVDLPERLPKPLVDEVQMVQVLVNLLVNARHAVAQTGRHGAVAIAARSAEGGRAVVLTVRDDGPGVPPEHRSRIFDPLYTTKEPGKGTGMGLALCQRIVISHGGSLRLLDEDGLGAAFAIRLPALPPET